MNHATPEATLSRWQAEGILARIGCTPDYIRHAARDIPRIAPMRNWSDRAVRIARGQPVDKKRPILPGSDPAPTTWEDKVKAARKAVNLAKGGMEKGKALIMAGLHPCYSSALTQCIAGTGKTVDPVLKGERFKAHDRAGTPFVRWFYDLPGALSADGPENQELRDAVKASGLTNGQIARASGIHITNLTAFLTGKQAKMLPHNREKVWRMIGRK